jgi:hypothetical protein
MSITNKSREQDIGDEIHWEEDIQHCIGRVDQLRCSNAAEPTVEGTVDVCDNGGESDSCGIKFWLRMLVVVNRTRGRIHAQVLTNDKRIGKITTLGLELQTM